MSKPQNMSPKELIANGVGDPRGMVPQPVQYAMEPPNEQERAVLGKDAGEYAVLRVGICQLNIGQQGANTLAQVGALLPPIFKFQQSRLVRASGDTTDPSFQAGLGPTEVRFVLNKSLFTDEIVAQIEAAQAATVADGTSRVVVPE